MTIPPLPSPCGLLAGCVGCPCVYRPAELGLTAWQVEFLRASLKSRRASIASCVGLDYYAGEVDAIDWIVGILDKLAEVPR